MSKKTNWKFELRNLHFKSIVCLIILCLFFNPRVYGVKNHVYKFTEAIYDQEEVLSKLRPQFSEEEINQKLEEELLRRKEEQLNRTILSRIEVRVSKLEEEFEEASKGQFRTKIIEAIKNSTTMAPMALMLAGGAIGSVVPVIGTAAGTAVGLGIGVAIVAGTNLGTEVAEKKVNNTRRKKTPPDMINQEIRDLEAEYDKLKEGLKTEPIGELERRYIFKKRHITGEVLRTEIERSLIQSRVADYFFQINTPAIGYALGIPLSPKAVLESKEELSERFEQDKSFSIYTKDIKEALFSIIFGLAVNSVTDTDNKSPLRVVEHWLGTGSTGKSTAAKEIARFLRLPYFEKRITSPDTEINMTNISGAIRSFQGAPNIGWLAEALLQKIEGEEKTYENPLLILDDFPVNTQTAQNTLLAITDPEKRTFFNEYLQTNINISRLNIIIISNDDFKSSKPAGESDHTFKALKTRFDTVVFPEFNEKQKGIIAKPYLEKTLVSKYKPPAFYKFKYVDPTKIEVEYDPIALDNMGFNKDYSSVLIPTGVSQNRRSSITIREIKRVLEKTISSYVTALSKKSNLSFMRWRDLIRTNTDGNFEIANLHLSLAALKGYTKALDILEALKSGEITKEILILEQKVEGRVGDLEQQKTNAAKVAEFYTTKSNIKKMKEWWGKAHQLGSHEHSYLICKHLIRDGAKIDFDEEDYRLLTMLQEYEGIDSKFSTPAGESSITIGGTLLTVGKTFQNNSSNPSPKQFDIARECFTASARLGNNEAPEALYRLGRELEDKQGLWSPEAITCYQEAESKNHLAKSKIQSMSHTDFFIEDLQESRSNFLISGVAITNQEENKKGVMTLCFKKKNEDYTNPVLVFEMFLPIQPGISLRMIRFEQPDTCCGEKKGVQVSDERETLKAVYRGREVSDVDGTQKPGLASYERYASWIVSNDGLLKGISQADEDESKKFPLNYSAVKYVIQILRTVGLKDINFPWWQRETPDNLKSLVGSLEQSKPTYLGGTIPEHKF